MFERLYFNKVTLQYSSEKVKSATVKKKVKQIFQTKKDFLTCSKLIINKLWPCPSMSDSACFANNEQTSLAFDAAYCRCRT